jgi:WD40 repeat protein
MTRPVCHPSLASLVLAISTSVVAGCASQDLGHGYRLIHVTVINPPVAFEALAHYDDLYYGLRKLGRVGEYDISPSGRYAAFEDDGTIRLFDRQSRRIHNITDGEFAVPSRFDWDESAGVLKISYYERPAPSRIALPVGARSVPVQGGT